WRAWRWNGCGSFPTSAPQQPGNPFERDERRTTAHRHTLVYAPSQRRGGRGSIGGRRRRTKGPSGGSTVGGPTALQNPPPPTAPPPRPRAHPPPPPRARRGGGPPPPPAPPHAAAPPAPTRGARGSLVDHLREISFLAHLFDQVELRLQPLDALFLAFEVVLEHL